MYRGLLTLGGVEIANSARTRAYMRAGLAPPTVTVGFDDTWSQTAKFQGVQEYRLPKLDKAPWWDPRNLDSADFAGVYPLSIGGLEAGTLQREVTEGIGHGGTFGPPRWTTRKIPVTALLIASSAPGVDYGMSWLTSILRGDRCKGDWSGQTLEFLASVPEADPSLSNAAFEACVAPYRREMHEVVCTRSPEIVERFGTMYGTDGQHAAAYKVEFELTAGIPWAWQPMRGLASDVAFNTAAAPSLIYFTIAQDGRCTANECQEAPSVLLDPLAEPVASLIRPIAPSTTLACEPLEWRRTTALIEHTQIPDFHDLVASVQIRSGSKVERNLRVRWVRRPVGVTDVEELLRCHVVSDAQVSYVPANATLRLDGVSARPYVTLLDGSRLDATPVVSGEDGAPWEPPVLACGLDDYMVVIDSDKDVSPQLRIDVDGAVRMP